MPEYVIRGEEARDHEGVASLHLAAFGADEPIPDLVKDLRAREASLPVISLVAVCATQEVIGHVLLSHAWLDAPASMVDVYLLSPLSVRPDVQGQGIGRALVAAAIEAAKAQAAEFVFLEGNPKFYRGSGFVPAGEIGVRPPSLRIPKNAFQVIVLVPDFKPRGGHSLGTLIYPDAFWTHDCVGLR